MEPSLTSQLLDLIETKAFSKDDRQRAAIHVLDWLACCSAGKNKEVAGNFENYIASSGIDASSNVAVVFGEACHWQDALLVNGAIGNILEMDDIHRSSILHPGPVVIPAALAVAQLKNCSMKDFLEAIILGYEITIRLGESIGRSHYAYFHNTATCAGFGATLAASHLLRLTKQQTLWALGNLGSRLGGLWQMRNETVMTKQWHNADAARNGVTTAMLAQSGVSGPLYILEGQQGVFKAFSCDADPDAFVEKHDRWRIFDCSFKPWPACRHAHPALEVVMSTIEDNNLSGSGKELSKTIKHITVKTYQDALTFCDRSTPTNENQAKFSIQHVIAAYIEWGQPALCHYYDESIPMLESLRSKVSVELDEELEGNYPYHYGASCLIELHDGEIFHGLQFDTLGDPEKPLSISALKEKAKMLMKDGQIDEVIIEKLLSLDWSNENNLAVLNSLIVSKVG